MILGFLLESAGCKGIVGGAPLSRKFAEEIGADGCGLNAPQAVEIIKQWAAA